MSLPRLTIDGEGGVTAAHQPEAFHLDGDPTGQPMEELFPDETLGDLLGQARMSTSPVPGMLTRSGGSTAVTVRRADRASDDVVVELDRRREFSLLSRQVEELNREVRRRRAAELRTQELLDITVAQLERANEDLENFLYIASHDLAEPLRGIDAYVTLLARRFEPHLDAEAHRHLEYVTDGTKRLRRMIDALLTASQLHGHQPAPTQVDIGGMLTGILADLRKTIERAPTPTEVETDAPEGLLVYSDPLLLRSIVYNLVTNAVRYGEVGRENRVLVSAVQGSDGRVVITVADRGIGIPERHHKTVFEPFNRIEAGAEGTGLGLSIARRAAHRIDGELTLVHSEPGAGSEFRLDLGSEAAARPKESA